ncbi:hypothetical protein Ae201684_001717 [Aphanomyces euteiches]|uniref:Uncharacterized protein n=1 Tax=Aphanomyces euteiches TaxID=100861 RepID=A0A6G0XT12_9STRA|nr:hypothetical protein Ae201684_001717 [Aphanomyces euteiches]KAH9156108.1 hypothetical protein AeRB84_001967 [Aphanomyces euteiches]
MRRNNKNIHADLALREVHGRPRNVKMKRRITWNFQDVAQVEDQAVLMGFSNNGRYLLFYRPWGQRAQVYWRGFNPCGKSLVSRDKVMQINVGPTRTTLSQHEYELDDDMELCIWESHDEKLVIATLSTRGQTSCHITIAPGPLLCQKAEQSTALLFSLSLTTPVHQSWFIVPATNQLVFHVGSSLLLMSMTLNGATEVFRPLTTAWYHPSEFPVEIVQESSQPHVLNKLICECKHQTTFDIETFLRSLLDTYAAFRPFHLHDYDLRYLCVSESSWIYMCGALDLERIDVPTWRRVGVFFAWNALDGAFKVIRLLTRPHNVTLTSAIEELVRHCRGVLSRHVSIQPQPFTMWSNHGVLRGASLNRIDNPIFPYSIVRSQM